MKNLLFIIGLVALSAAVKSQDESNFIPLPTPTWSEPKSDSGNKNYILSYNLNSKEELIVDSVSSNGSDLPDSQISEPQPGVDIPVEFPGQRDFSGLTYVQNTAVYPYSTIVRLYVTYDQGSFVCTGALIKPNIVLTAGHCIYDKNYGGWPNSVKVVPGYNNQNQPFGYAMAEHVYSFTKWTEDENFDWDMGSLILDRPIGHQTGYLGYGCKSDDDYFLSNTFYTQGYPGENPYDGKSMYKSSGTFDFTYTDQLVMNKKMYHGQSGSPLYNADNIIYGVLSHVKSNNQTGSTRITAAKFNFIKSWVAAKIENVADDLSINFSVYPNPATDKITIELPVDLHVACDIYITDLTGKEIEHYTLIPDDAKKDISIKNLNSGYYFVSCTCGKVRGTKSFIKM